MSLTFLGSTVETDVPSEVAEDLPAETSLVKTEETEDSQGVVST